MPDFPINRRNFLGIGCLALAMRPLLAQAAGTELLSGNSRSLSFYNLHTGEKLNAVYWEKGQYIPESLNNINQILRDYRTGDIFPIVSGLLDTLCVLHTKLETTEPFEIISGYRSPATNAMLRS